MFVLVMVFRMKKKTLQTWLSKMQPVTHLIRLCANAQAELNIRWPHMSYPKVRLLTLRHLQCLLIIGPSSEMSRLLVFNCNLLKHMCKPSNFMARMFLLFLEYQSKGLPVPFSLSLWSDLI